MVTTGDGVEFAGALLERASEGHLTLLLVVTIVAGLATAPGDNAALAFCGIQACVASVATFFGWRGVATVAGRQPEV